ncbi:MAG: SDR family oxidoreductase [Bacteroidota bacterium]
MKIGITGATGQLGRLVVNDLKEKTAAENIVALVRSPQKAADLGVTVREFDYNKPENLCSALQGIDSLLLISANEIGKRFEQHTHIIDAAKQAGVKWIVYTSLLKADTTSIVLKDEHLATEAALKSSGIAYTLLRHGWYTENYTQAILGALAQGVMLGCAAHGKISAASRADFAKAAAVVLTTAGHQGKIYELAGDDAFTMSELAAEISHQTGKTIVYNNVSVAEYTAALINMGIPEFFAQFYASTDSAITRGDLFENHRLLSKLSGQPTTPMAKTVATILA